MINIYLKLFVFALFFMASTIIYPLYASWCEENKSTKEKKRDPFVALVGSDGKIIPKEKLFPPDEKKTLSMNIRLKAIIWDKKRPLAMVNNKIYGKGEEIAGGLIITDIGRNSITLDDHGLVVSIPLRKKPGKK